MAAYVGSGSPGLAEKVFDGMAERDAASWNTVISGAVKHGASGRAMELFREMRKTGWAGDSFTLSCLIGGAVAVRCGAVQMVHAHAVKTGLELEVSVGNSLMAFYAKLGSEDGVLDLFERMPERDSISWNEMIRGLLVSGSVETATRAFKRCPVKNGVTYNTLIAGLIQNEEPVLALNLFLEMVEKGVELSDYTLSAAITAAGKVPGVCEQLHAFATKSGGSSDDWVAAALLSTYGRCGRTDLAEKIFQKWEHDQSRVVAATALLSARSGELRPCEALDLFRQMAGEPLMMDRVSITTALRLSGELGFADLGRQLHGYLCKSGEHLTDTQAQNSLLSMYARCGNMEDATRVFSSMADHDVVSWNALISGHVLHRLGDEALRLWQAMEEEGIEPDPETFRLLITAWKFARGGSVSDCNLLLERAPVAVNYAMTLDAMGACGELGTATELARSMPDSLHAWAALLRRSSGELQQEAARNVLMAEPESVAEHILAANLYAAAGRWRCAEAARKKMKEKGLRKWPAQSWVIAGATIESFYARDKAHERSRDIYASLEVLIREGIKHGYEPDTRFVLQEVEEFQKREFVFTHSAKLAVAYGHMVEPLGKAIRVMKNVRLCGDCHDFLKVFSVITGREVLLRDTTGFHHFCHGRCSCADRW
ncbi:pentatricopeptide repeat (PPR) superfamily protein [Wolffia australiana]